MTKIPDDILLQLGRLTVNFGTIEVQLRFILWGLIGSDQRIGQIMTAEISYRQMLRALRAAASHKIGEGETLDRLLALLERAGAVEDRRNTLVHSFYAVSEDGSVTRVKMSAKEKKGFHVATEAITAKEIETVSGEIHAISEALKPFLQQYATFAHA